MKTSREAFSCLVTVDEQRGKKIIRLSDRHGYDQFLDHYGIGEQLELTVATLAASHSDKQRRFLHGPVLDAFIEMGYRKQEAKDMLALTFIPQTIKLPDGSYVRVPGHTEALSREEYSAFIESCIQLAAEEGHPVKDAAEWRESERQRKAAAAKKRSAA